MSLRRWIALLLIPTLIALSVTAYWVAERPGSIAAAAVWLDANASLKVDIPAGASPRLYAFSANLLSDTQVRLSTDNADFAFAAEIRDSQGGLVASLDGSRLLDARLTIGPGQSAYQVSVGSATARKAGTVTLALGAPSTESTPTPPVCGMIPAAGAPIPVYAAPQTRAVLIGQLPAAGLLIARGRLRGGWYAADAAGLTGWVEASSVRLQGACADLPVVLDPTIPSAPQDTEPHTLYADRDGSGSLTGAVGAPNGDWLDSAWIIVLNLYDRPPANYREFGLTLTCSGIGSENVRWGAPQKPAHRCGETLRLPFLYALARQPIVVLVPSGSEQSYVDYTLSAVSLGAS